LAASDTPPPPDADAGADDEDEAVEEAPPPAALDDWELELLDPPQAATPSASTELAARSESLDITGLLFRPTLDSGPIHDKPHHRRVLSNSDAPVANSFPVGAVAIPGAGSLQPLGPGRLRSRKEPDPDGP
jgi:hypothetical protein